MQLASSWIPGGLISAEPQQALLIFVLFLSLFCFFSYILSFFLFLFCFAGLHPGHMVVPRLGIQLQLQLPATALALAPAPAPAPATQDPSRLCKLHHSSRQCQILNTRIEAETSWVLVGFVSTAPWQELLFSPFKFDVKRSKQIPAHRCMCVRVHGWLELLLLVWLPEEVR